MKKNGQDRLFHKLQHLRYHKESRFRDIENGYWLEEQAVYLNEFEIMYQLFGKKYRDAIDRSALKVKLMINAGKFTEKNLKDIAEHVLDNIFEKPKSVFEDKIMRGAIIINIGFVGMDMNGKGSTKNQALFIKSLIEKEKILFAGR